MSEPQVLLKVAGLPYSGWKALRAEVGVEQCSGAFDMSVMDRWAEQKTAWPIRPGDACELLLADQIVITGYTDSMMPRIDGKLHQIRVKGRDKTLDLIDCSAIYKSGQWKNVKVDRIARDIAKPFNIEVVAVGDMGAAFDSFHIEEGERAFEAIDRAARMRSLLTTTDGTGRLVLTRASTVKVHTALVEGTNIYDAELDLSWKERHSEIIVKGQGKGTATTFGDKVAHGEGRSKDDSITRYRPLIVISEHHGKSATFAQRAEWERNVRRGRGTRASVTVVGWTMDDGKLWKPNVLVPVYSPTLGIYEDLLIAKCIYTLNANGTFTELQLVHPAAFEVLAGIKGTRLDRKITGENGLENNRKHAKKRAKGGAGAIIDLETGKPGSGGTP